MSIVSTLQRYQEAFLRLLYPAHCGACNKGLELEETGLCSGCRADLAALRFPYSEAALNHSFDHVRQAWTLYPYEAPLKEILTGIKFFQKRWLLKLFVPDFQELGSLIASESSYDMIVPVPMESTRLLERHFNQSELIAKMLSGSMKVPMLYALKKIRRTPAQSGLNRAERLQNLLFAFEGRVSLSGKKILLVDDVLTTGATAEEAARVLKEECGAVSVDLVTLACNPRETPDKSFSPLYIPSNFVGY